MGWNYPLMILRYLAERSQKIWHSNTSWPGKIVMGHTHTKMVAPSAGKFFIHTISMLLAINLAWWCNMTKEFWVDPNPTKGGGHIRTLMFEHIPFPHENSWTLSCKFDKMTHQGQTINTHHTPPISNQNEVEPPQSKIFDTHNINIPTAAASSAIFTRLYCRGYAVY